MYLVVTKTKNVCCFNKTITALCTLLQHLYLAAVYFYIFVVLQATCVGHVIGAVVADNHAHAQRAARLVEVTYEDLHPVIVTIEVCYEDENVCKSKPKLSFPV